MEIYITDERCQLNNDTNVRLQKRLPEYIVLFRPDKYEGRIDVCNEPKSACYKG